MPDKTLKADTEEKKKYVLSWLSMDSEAAPPKKSDIEHLEKRFDNLIDSLHKEKKKQFLYKPRTSK